MGAVKSGTHAAVRPLGDAPITTVNSRADDSPTTSRRLLPLAVYVTSILSAVYVTLIVLGVLDPEPAMPQIKYGIQAVKEHFSSRRVWSAGSFSKEHRMDVIDEVPIRGSQMVHVHNVCVEGGKNFLALPHLRSLEELGALETYQPGSHKPAAFRAMDSEEMATIFPRKRNASQPGATQVWMCSAVRQDEGLVFPHHWSFISTPTGTWSDILHQLLES